jgi:hypothetical protein
VGGDVRVRPRGLPQAWCRPGAGARGGGPCPHAGARAIEAYPIPTKNVIAEELHVGTPSVFADAGLVEVNRPTVRRLVMRLDL